MKKNGKELQPMQGSEILKDHTFEHRLDKMLTIINNTPVINIIYFLSFDKASNYDSFESIAC